MHKLTSWVFQTGEPLPSDEGHPRPMRAMNLAQALVAAGHDVVLWSSDFFHQEKRARTGKSTKIQLGPNLVVRLIPSPGYGANVGPGRLYDHAVLARNLKAELARESIAPDVAFVGYPPIETAATLIRWLAARGVPTLLDVKDLWPTLFLDPLPGPLRPIGRLALAPYFRLARRAMAQATGISAMADGFLDWALRFAGRQRRATDMVAPLTSPPEQVSATDLSAARARWDSRGVTTGRPRVFFVGSHSRSFDFAPVAEAAQLLARSRPELQIVVCGQGEYTEEWRRQTSGARNVIFPGWIDRAEINALAERSLAMLAPYRSSEDFALSIPNKVLDAMSLGVPIATPLRGEVERLVQEGGVGVRYDEGSGESLAAAIESLLANPSLRERLSTAARECYADRFSYEQVYGGLVRHLEGLAKVSA